MILVTGSSGVLGTALTQEIGEHYSDVEAIKSSDVDLRNFDSTLSYFQARRPDIIYHAAARVHGLMGNRMFPNDVYVDNIRINTNVVEAARLSGCQKFIAISTVAAYPDTQKLPIREDFLLEGPPHHSEQAYAHSKRAMLGHLQACQVQYGMNFTYVLLTNLYGLHDRFDEAHGHVIPSLISKFHRAAREGGKVTIWGTGRARRDFLFSSDAASAIRLVGQKASGPINVASGMTVPVSSVVDCLSRISGVSDVAWDDTKPDGQLDRSYDVTRLRELGFHPRVGLEEGLRLTYEWYSRSYPNVRT